MTPTPTNTNTNTNETPDDWETVTDTTTVQQEEIGSSVVVTVNTDDIIDDNTAVKSSVPEQKKEKDRPKVKHQPRQHHDTKWNLTKKEVKDVVELYLVAKNKKKGYLTEGQIKAAIASVGAVKNQTIKKGASLELLGGNKKMTPQTLSYVEMAAGSIKECFTRQITDCP